MRALVPLLAAALVPCLSCATQPGAARGGPEAATAAAGRAVSADPASPPGLELIREADIQRDILALAGDAMRGREAGTIDELRASVWLAERGREAGMQPAGLDDTFFQFFPLERTVQSPASRIAIGETTLRPGRDVAVLALTQTAVSAPIVWVEDADSAALATVDLTGRAAATRLRIAERGAGVGAARRQVTMAANAVAGRLRARGAVAVILVADDATDAVFDVVSAYASRGRYQIEGQPQRPVPVTPPSLLIRPALQPIVAAPGARLDALLAVASYTYPSVNVIGVVRGTDPLLRDEYVLFSSHQDHDGVRGSFAGADSIWNGADDNATTSVALLAIARAFAAHPGRRSALFVWHGAEERGLFGSRYHVEHPVVPRESIVAVLNGDMMGRNAPDSAALLGVIPPHRNSTALAQMALDANRRITTFTLDSTWDRPEHREGWYFRSDHLPYARANIPALFFTTLLHPDYHTPLDDPERIDVAKLTRMTRWLYATGWAVAVTPERPGLDPGFRLER